MVRRGARTPLLVPTTFPQYLCFKMSRKNSASSAPNARFVDFNKDTDGVEVGLITLTNGKTSAWYTESVVDYSTCYFEQLEKNTPLNWKLDVLVICGHGRTSGNSLKSDGSQKATLEELATFIENNMTVKKILVNACHGGDSGDDPGSSFANKLSKRLGVICYGPVESIARADSKGKFYNKKTYNWNRFNKNKEKYLGEHSLDEMIPYVLHGRDLSSNDDDDDEPSSTTSAATAAFLAQYPDANWVFSYGSNSVVQLRGRLNNPDLVSFPAFVKGWDRIFCMSSRGWAESGKTSGIASMCKNKKSSSACTYGSATPMSNEDLSKLDGFEASYEKVSNDITVKFNGELHTIPGVFYIAKDNIFVSKPSEQYLTAIHLMLREQWPETAEEGIVIRGVKEGTTEPVKIGEWKHPGNASLTLSSVCVEVNAKKANPWKMPVTIDQIVSKFEKVNIKSSTDLNPYLASTDKMKELNSILKKSGQTVMNLDTLDIFKEVISS